MMSTSDLSVSEISKLVIESQNGNKESFGVLYQHFYAQVYKTVFRCAKNTASSEELTQEVFLKVFLKIKSLNEPKAFGGWLKVIATRHVINHFRKLSNRVVELNIDSCDHEDFESFSQLSVMLKSEKRSLVLKAIDNLSEPFRSMIFRFYVENGSYKTLACEFKIPLGTVQSRLNTARSRIKEYLTEKHEIFG